MCRQCQDQGVRRGAQIRQGAPAGGAGQQAGSGTYRSSLTVGTDSVFHTGNYRSALKGQSHEIFCSRFFPPNSSSWSH